MNYSLCQRCSVYARCSLNYDGKPCRKLRDVEPTNYDRIKDMSVDELADLLARRELSCMPFCKQCDICNERTFSYPFCVEGVKKWLESEVDDDG